MLGMWALLPATGRSEWQLGQQRARSCFCFRVGAASSRDTVVAETSAESSEDKLRAPSQVRAGLCRAGPCWAQGDCLASFTWVSSVSPLRLCDRSADLSHFPSFQGQSQVRPQCLGFFYSGHQRCFQWQAEGRAPRRNNCRLT